MKTVYQIFKFFPVTLSVLALIVSVLSYQISKQSLEHEVNRDMMINTPAIKESIDSTEIKFSLNGNAELQGIQIIFPNSFYNRDLIRSTKPVTINKSYLETLAKNYCRNIITKIDSTVIVGTFSVPVLISYSAIVYGFPQQLRENRLLIFNIHFSDNIEGATFTNSFLTSRCGYPIKRHYFFTTPFSSPLDQRIDEQDKLDVQELLERQFEEIKKNMNDRDGNS